MNVYMRRAPGNGARGGMPAAVMGQGQGPAPRFPREPVLVPMSQVMSPETLYKAPTNYTKPQNTI